MIIAGIIVTIAAADQPIGQAGMSEEEIIDLIIAEDQNQAYQMLSGILIGVGFLLVLISFGARRKKDSAKRKEKKPAEWFKGFNLKLSYKYQLIQAEISVYPMATKTTSASFYIAKAIESIQKIENLRYEINPMGTILESDDIDVINSATKQMTETVHNLGIARVEVIIKIDSRRDKHLKMEEKLESIKKQMN